MKNERLYTVVKDIDYTTVLKYTEEQLMGDNKYIPFMVEDIYGICKDLNKNDITIYNIVQYYGKNGLKEEKEKYIKEILKDYDSDNTIICTRANINILEFPDDKYYSSEIGEAANGREEIPFEAAMKRECEFLESFGFININKFIGYNYSEAYIYGNSLGKEVVDYIISNEEE